MAHLTTVPLPTREPREKADPELHVPDLAAYKPVQMQEHLTGLLHVLENWQMTQSWFGRSKRRS